MRIRGLENTKRIYFIGIGGVSMSALAKFLLSQGYCVSGSDAVKSVLTDNLRLDGIEVFVGEDLGRRALKEADLVVYTDAILPAHTELQTAKALNKKIYSRAEVLSLICNAFPHTLAVAGSHGKTTCTSMCAHVLQAANAEFTAHIGGEDLAFGNYYSKGLDYFVTEACEYKKNILKITADRAILLNIDKDHMECYDGEKDLLFCFGEYCKKAEAAFVCADDEKCLSLGRFSTFGIENLLSDYHASDLRAINERYSFTIEEYGNPICRLQLKAVGKCNVYNALAAFAVMRSYGFNERQIKQGIEAFTAVKRRFERVGEYYGATVICDYAHHPREIAATIITAKGICRGELYVVFQPHTYSRTILLFEEFVKVLKPVENLMIYKTYGARERFIEEGSAKTLSCAIGNSLYAENVDMLGLWLKSSVKEGDVILVLGAGDIYYAAQYLVQKSR